MLQKRKIWLINYEQPARQYQIRLQMIIINGLPLSKICIVMEWKREYYLDQKVPGIHSENSKYKFYSSKVILSLSKYSPSTATHLCQRLIQLSKHFWNSIVGITVRVVFDFSITFFRLLKRVPRNGFLTRSNRKKSQGTTSGEMAVGWYSFRSWSKIHG